MMDRLASALGFAATAACAALIVWCLADLTVRNGFAEPPEIALFGRRAPPSDGNGLSKE